MGHVYYLINRKLIACCSISEWIKCANDSTFYVENWKCVSAKLSVDWVLWFGKHIFIPQVLPVLSSLSCWWQKHFCILSFPTIMTSFHSLSYCYKGLSITLTIELFFEEKRCNCTSCTVVEVKKVVLDGIPSVTVGVGFIFYTGKSTERFF